MDEFIGNLYFHCIIHRMFTYYMKKIPSRCLYNVKIYKHGHEFGNLNFQIETQTKHAVLNNIEMNEKC